MNEYWTRPRQKNDILVLKEREIKEDFELELFHLDALMSSVQAAFNALLDAGTRPKSPELRLKTQIGFWRTVKSAALASCKLSVHFS